MGHPATDPAATGCRPPTTFAEAVAQMAETWPDSEALVIGPSRMTFAALQARVATVAANLHRLGLGRGQKLAICMGNSTDWVAIFLAAATLGMVIVPINTRYKAAEIRYCLQQSDADALVVCDRFLNIDFIAMLREICPAIDAALPDAALPNLRTILVAGSDVPAAAVSAADLFRPCPGGRPQTAGDARGDDIALLQYTSGTTSFPKGVLLTQDSLLFSAASVGQKLGLVPGDRYFSPRPFCHIGGLMVSMMAAILAGACFVGAEQFDADKALDLLERERCTHTNGNDTILLMLLQHPRLDARKLALRGGWAAASPELLDQARTRLNMVEICSAYGLSEAGGNVAVGPHDDPPEVRLSGYAMPHEGIEVQIRSLDDGTVLGPGQSGEIFLRGPRLMRGYYNMPEQTEKTIDRNGWLYTGDIGAVDAAGRICYMGRSKEMFRVGGFNVAPAEVEDVLHKHGAIRQAQVVGVPDPRLVEVPAAYVILREGTQATPADIIAWCRERMANFRVPRYVRIVESFDAIQTSASAKVQKARLREQAIRDFGL